MIACSFGRSLAHSVGRLRCRSATFLSGQPIACAFSWSLFFQRLLAVQSFACSFGCRLRCRPAARTVRPALRVRCICTVPVFRFVAASGSPAYRRIGVPVLRMFRMFRAGWAPGPPADAVTEEAAKGARSAAAGGPSCGACRSHRQRYYFPALSAKDQARTRYGSAFFGYTQKRSLSRRQAPLFHCAGRNFRRRLLIPSGSSRRWVPGLEESSGLPEASGRRGRPGPDALMSGRSGLSGPSDQRQTVGYSSVAGRMTTFTRFASSRIFRAMRRTSSPPSARTACS